MRQGLSYFHETIFSSLPVFYRRIDTALRNIGQPMLPIDHNLFQVCSRGEPCYLGQRVVTVSYLETGDASSLS